MVIRDSILCGHCAATQARATCPGCKLEVCADCAIDRRRCKKPSAIELRLGLGARLRDIDPSGRWGLATTLRGKLVRLDLDRLERRSIEADVTDATILASGELAGEIWDGSTLLGYRRGARLFGGISGTLDRSGSALAGFGSSVITVVKLDESPVAGLGPLETRIKPFRRAAVSAIGYDASSDRLACATYGRVVIWAVEAQQRCAEIGAGHRDIGWVALAGDTVAALLATGGLLKRRYELALWSVSTGDVVARAELGNPREPLADLSADGAIAIAAAEDSELVVLEIGRSEPDRFAGHSDGLTTLRISGEGSRIVSGDFDNRVIIRDRNERGFPRRIEPAALTRL